MGTTQEMVVLINPKCGCVASVQAVEDATDPQARKKKRSRKSVEFPTHHVTMGRSSSSIRKTRLVFTTRRKSSKANTELLIPKQDYLKPRAPTSFKFQGDPLQIK